MSVHRTQQAAFDARKSNEKIFQNQSKSGRYYVAATLEKYWSQYLAVNIRSGCELIEKDKPCHLFIDLDVNKEKYPQIDVNQIWVTLEKYIDFLLTEYREIPMADITKQLHFSSDAKKGSMHIIYQIKGKIFQSAAHVGAFMRCVQQYVDEESEADAVIFDNRFVDMGIYTQNRLFRMLGCTKFGQQRYLTNGNDLTFQNWSENLVQPLENDADIIPIAEPDNSSPRYSSGGTGCSSGITGWTPDCVAPLLEYLSEKYARVTRIHAFPMSFTFACNLATKVCPFKGAEHSSNVLYVVINLVDFSYRVRCHSSKCHSRAQPENNLPGKKFPEEYKQAVDDFLNHAVDIPAILPDAAKCAPGPPIACE